MASSQGFQTLHHDHQDLVLAVDYNFYGDRLVTASSDHKLKVWDKKGDAWDLCDSWTAHDAEITDVKWNGPFVGQVLGSIGEDGFFKLWEEDLAQAPGSGRRFRRIMQPVLTKSKLPWMSIDFKNIGMETYLALITREGNLSIMEPKEHDNLAGDWIDWMENQNFLVCQPPPPRSEETSFRVCFHHEKLPAWPAIAAGLDRKALSLAVTAMDVVKVYRTDNERRLYVAAELTGAKGLVRDVSWANGSMRGYDVIATAGKDGVIRVYELKTIATGTDDGGADKPADVVKGSQETRRPSQKSVARNAPSGIGAGLAGARAGSSLSDEGKDGAGRIKHTVELVSELAEHHSAVWRVQFSYIGDLLTSTADDGAIKTWKKAISGKWLEYASIDISKGH